MKIVIDDDYAGMHVEVDPEWFHEWETVTEVPDEIVAEYSAAVTALQNVEDKLRKYL